MPPPRLSRLAREPQFFPSVAKDGPGSGGSLAFPTPTLFWALGGFPSSTGVPVSQFTAIQSTTVYGCVKARSEDLAKVPLRLKRREAGGGAKIDTSHPIARLLMRPNDWMTPFTFKQFIETSICLRGNAYVVIRRNAGGDPLDLIPIHPDSCSPRISPGGEMFYMMSHPLLAPNSEPKRFHSENVLHIKNFPMDAGYIGVSPIAASQEAIGLALATQQHGAILFRQGAQVSGVLEHPGSLSDLAKDQISRSFGDKFQGVQNAHKVPVLEEGMKFTKISMTSEDAQFIETRKFQSNEICRLFRVPPHKVMDLTGSTYSNMEIAEQAYINDALLPDATQIVQECENKLLFDDERGDFTFDWNWDELLRADRKTRYDANAVGLNNGFLSVNEVRLLEGRDRIPNGDDYNRPLNIGALNTPTQTPGDMAPNPTPKPAETSN
jgi:HK97 family phage portal protein